MENLDTRIKSFLNMNSKGINLLTAGQPLSAMNYFLKAAVELQHALDFQEEQETAPPTPTVHSVTGKNSRTKKEEMTLMNDKNQMQDDPPSLRCLFMSIPNFGDGQFYVFNKVIMFPVGAIENKCTLQLAKKDLLFYCGAVMFNLALTYHWIGQGWGLRMATREALYCYETALNLLRLDASSFMFSDMKRIKLAVAAWNNISQIRHQENDFHHSRRTFANVQTLLASQKCPIFDQEIYKELSLNGVLLLNLATCAPSAPSA